MFLSSKSPTYGMTKKNYISISLQNEPFEKKVAKKASSKTKTIKQKKKKKKKRSSVDSVSEDVDVDSLFDNVWTKKVDTKVKKTKKIDAKRIAEIQKSVDMEEYTASHKPHANATAKDKGGDSKTKKNTSSGEEVNEYLAKIHAIVYDHFFPPANTQGYEVKAVIELSPLGKVLDFRILNYSPSEALNQEADNIKERLRTILFPKNPHAQSARVVIILKPDNKE